MRLVFFDLETGGLDPSTDPVIQIAAVAVDANLKTIEELEVKIRFDSAQVPQDVLDINHFTPEAWSKAVSEFDALNMLSAFAKRYADVRMVSKRTGNPYFVSQFVGHNAAGFDGLFLKAMYQRHDMFMPISYRILDTLQRAMWHFHEAGVELESYGLESLCVHFGINIEGNHDALVDTRATVEVYRQLLNSNPSFDK